MPRRCLAMLSRGLDGALAARMMQRQGIEVEGFHYVTPIAESQTGAERWAERLGIRLHVINAGDGYFDLVRHPKFPRGEGANPCVDCRIAAFAGAQSFLKSAGCDFVVSGEILGQRPLGQKRLDLEIIARHSGLDDRLLRPLSAKRLDLTLPEREGWVDREQLCDFVGASRKGLIELAHQFGWSELPAPGICCKLADRQYAAKACDLMKRPPVGDSTDFKLLAVGRHFRINADTKLIVARTGEEARELEFVHVRNATRMLLLEGVGPLAQTGLVVGDLDRSLVQIAATILTQQGGAKASLPRTVKVTECWITLYEIEVTQDMVDQTHCRPIGGGNSKP